MKSEHEEKLCINPVKEYETPKIPTLDSANVDHVLLKKLPSRWKRNAAVVACVGIMGVAILVGCASTADPLNGSHHGGAGGLPFYVVHLTEQEALGIIRAQLETAGLNLGAIPPNYDVTVYGQNIGIDLFDEERNVAVVKMEQGWSREGARRVEQEFSNQMDINVGVFYNPEELFEVRMSPTDEQRETARAINEKRLVEQVQAFIALLQEQGVLE